MIRDYFHNNPQAMSHEDGAIVIDLDDIEQVRFFLSYALIFITPFSLTGLFVIILDRIQSNNLTIL